MPLLSQGTSNLMSNLLGSLPQGQRMGFAGSLAAGLAAGNKTLDDQQIRSNAQRDALQRSRELELELLKYQADTLAGATAQAKKEREASQLRKQIKPELQELYDVDPKRAIEQTFQDPISPFQSATLAQGAQTEDRLERALGHTISNDDRVGDRADATFQRDVAKDEFTGTLQTEAALRDQKRLQLEEEKANQPDKFTQDVQRILAANPDLQGSEEGIQRAMNIAQGLIQTNTDPVRGGTATTNLATNESVPVETPQRQVERLPVPTDAQGAEVPPIRIEDMAQEIGAYAFAEDWIGRTLGQVNPEIVDEARARAATQLDFIRQKAIVAFSSSYRPLAVEAKNIIETIPTKGVFDSGARATATMQHLRNLAIKQHNDYADQIESGNMSYELEAEAIQKMGEIRSFVELLPTDQSSEQTRPEGAAAPDTGGTGAVGTTPDQITDPDPLGLR